MNEYDDGTEVWEDKDNLKIVVKDAELGKFEIEGFENASQMRMFVNFFGWKDFIDHGKKDTEH